MAKDPTEQQLAAAIHALGKAETELAALRAVARGYCPDCGRGDAAPTVWERERQRAEQAEVAGDRVRALVDECEARGTGSGYPLTVTRLREALGPAAARAAEPAWTPPPPGDRREQLPDHLLGEHKYTSTGCLHGQHAYCQSNAGLAGRKKPGVCKWCEAKCQCPCHLAVIPKEGDRASGGQGA